MTPVGARRLAVLMLLLATATLAFFVLRRSYAVVPLVGATAAGCAVYLVLSRKARAVDSSTLSSLGPVATRRLKRLLPTLFFLFTAASLAVLIPVMNEKPIEYYVLASGSAAVLAFYILLGPNRRETAFATAMLLVASGNLLGSSLLAFPIGLGGADSSTHIHFLVAPIVATGAIPTGPDGVLEGCALIYETFPAHHLMAASGAFVLGLDAAHAYYALGFLVMLLPIVVAVVVGRKIFGVRAGLLGALLLAGSSYYIGWAAHAAPITYALPLIAGCILVLFKIIDVRRARLLLAAFPLILALVLTHPYSSLIFGVILLGIVAGHRIAERDYRASTWGPSVVGIAFAYTLIIDWTNFSCLVGKSFQLLTGYYRHFTQETLEAGPNVTDALPLPVILVNTIGDSILFALAAVGFLAMLHRKVTARHMLVLGPLVTLLGLSALGLLTRLEYILPNRIYVFLQFAGLAPLAGFGIRYAARHRGGIAAGARQGASLAIAALLVGGLVFASSTSIIAGFETSPFAGDRPYVKLYDTRYERAVAAWVCDYAGTPSRAETSLSLHGLARQRIVACLQTETNFIGKLPVTKNGFINMTRLVPGELVVFSYFDVDPGFLSSTTGIGQTGSGVYGRLDPAAPAELDQFNKIYDAGPIEVYQVVP